MLKDGKRFKKKAYTCIHCNVSVLSGSSASGGKSTGATRNNVIDRQSRVQKIRYNRVLSPIDENVAYLDLEHYRLGNARLSEDRTQTTEFEHHPFQNYVDKGSGTKRELKGSNLGHKRRHGMRRRHSDNGSIPHHDREHSQRTNHEPVVLEDIPLKEIISKSHKNKQPEVDDQKHDDNCEKRKVTFHKRHLYHTYSDPTAHRSRTRVANADYVGYNVIENFLKESNFVSAGDHPKPKVVRSNSEPLMKVPTEFLQKSFFIDAYDDKSKSLEDLNSNTAEKVLAKISDKNTMDGKDNFKRKGKGFEPIEAYRGEIDKYRNSEKNSIEVIYDDQVPSTSKSITQSSLYPVSSFNIF